jgi:hypothetical protein
VLVAMEEWNKPTSKALALATGISPDVIVFHLTHLSGPDGEEHERGLRARWRKEVETPACAARIPVPRLVILQAEYRTIHQPVLKLIEKLEAQSQDRRVAVLIPEIVKSRWYQHLLHAHHAGHLRSALLRHGGNHVTVMQVPWHADDVPARPDATAQA